MPYGIDPGVMLGLNTMQPNTTPVSSDGAPVAAPVQAPVAQPQAQPQQQANPIIAQTQDGVQHVFPPGTDPDVVQSAIKSYLINTKQFEEGWGDSLKGSALGVGNAMAGASAFMASLPERAIESFTKSPSEAEENQGAFVGQASKDITNWMETGDSSSGGPVQNLPAYKNTSGDLNKVFDVIGKIMGLPGKPGALLAEAQNDPELAKNIQAMANLAVMGGAGFSEGIIKSPPEAPKPPTAEEQAAIQAAQTQMAKQAPIPYEKTAIPEPDATAPTQDDVTAQQAASGDTVDNPEPTTSPGATDWQPEDNTPQTQEGQATAQLATDPNAVPYKGPLDKVQAGQDPIINRLTSQIAKTADMLDDAAGVQSNNQKKQLTTQLNTLKNQLAARYSNLGLDPEDWDMASATNQKIEKQGSSGTTLNSGIDPVDLFGQLRDMYTDALGTIQSKRDEWTQKYGDAMRQLGEAANGVSDIIKPITVDGQTIRTKAQAQSTFSDLLNKQDDVFQNLNQREKSLSAESTLLETNKALRSMPDKGFQNMASQARDSAHSDLGTDLSKEPPDNVTPLKPKGSGGKLASGIDPEEFAKFAGALPEAFKGQAKKLYQAWKDQQAKAQDPTVPISKNQPQMSVIKDIPGLNTALKNITDIETPFEDLKPQILKEPDINANDGRFKQLINAPIGQRLVSGGRMYAFMKQNTLLTYGIQKVLNASKDSLSFISSKVVPLSHDIRANFKEIQQMWPQMVMDEGKGVLTEAELKRQGFSDKAIGIWKQLRDLSDEAYKEANAARAMTGKGPVHYRPGYIASRFLGDFKFEVNSKDGTLTHWIGAVTRGQALKLQKYFQEKHPDLDVGDVLHRPSNRGGDTTQLMDSYHNLLAAMGDDPFIKSLEDTFAEYQKGEAYNFLNFKNRFMAKRDVPVQGFEGSKEWLSNEQNAKDGFQSMLTYVEQAHRWSAMQKSMSELKSIFADQDVAKTQPNTIKYLKMYSDAQQGKLNFIGKFVDDFGNLIANTTGIGKSQYIAVTRDIKQILTLFQLSNPIFWEAQALQPAQMLPGMLAYLKSKGASGDVISSPLLGSMDVLQNKNFQTGVGARAIAWAKGNHRIDTQVLQDIRGATLGNVSNAIKTVGGWTIQKVENFTRYHAFLSLTHFLVQSGMEEGQKLYKTAANLTDLIMTDYSLGERPLVYQNMGILGEAMSTLTTFKHNQYSQLAAYGEMGRAKGTGFGFKHALAVAVGTQLFMSGLNGMYARQDVDSAIRSLNQLAGLNIPTLSSAIMKTTSKMGSAGDFLAFGMPSWVQGMDLSQKLSAGNLIPDGLMDALFPLGSQLTKAAGGAWDFATSLGSKDASIIGQKGRALLEDLSPTLLHGWTEQLSTDNKGLYTNPRSNEGQYRRNTEDTLARLLGGRSLNESRQAESTYELKTHEANQQALRTNLIDNAKRTTDPQTIGSLRAQYTQLGGNPMDFYQALMQHQITKNQTAFQKAQGQPRNLPGLERYQQGQEYKQQ